MILDSYLGAHKTILQYMYIYIVGNGSGDDICEGGRHGLWGFWSFGLPMILGQIMYTILSLTSRSLNSMYHICLSWIHGMHSLTHRICWDSADQ